MPIQLLFLNASLKEICERHHAAGYALGTETARRLRARLADIQAAESISDLPAGKPTFDAQHSDRVAIKLSESERLELEAANNPVPTNGDGAVEWVKVTKVRVIGVGNDHE